MKVPAFLGNVLPWNTIALLVLMYAVLCMIVFFLQRRMIYYPFSEFVATPDEAGLDYRDVEFGTKDGVTLHAWLVEPKAGPARAHLLFFHGNGGNVSYSVEAARHFSEMGFRTLIVDYRGYGRSEGSPGEKGLYRDGEASLRFFCDECGLEPGEVIFAGRSLGGGVALELALRERPAGLVLESPFASIREMAGVMGYIFPLGILLRDRFDNAGKVGGLACPLLVIHSKDDDVVPYAQGVKVFEGAPEPKTFVEIGGGHDDGYYETFDVYRAAWEMFVGEVGKETE